MAARRRRRRRGYARRNAGRIVLCTFIEVIVICTLVIMVGWNKGMKEWFAQFQQEQYKKNGIVRGEKEDEVRYEGNLVVKNGFFEGDIQSELTLLHIYCMKNLKRSDWLDGTLNGCITMRKNVASVEFNNKFNVFVPAQMERDCMKFLSPSRQLEMIRTSAFDRIEQIHISFGKIQGNTQDIVLRPKEQIDIHNCPSIRKVYEEIQEYCQDIRQMADDIQMEYLQIVKIVEA